MKKMMPCFSQACFALFFSFAASAAIGQTFNLENPQPGSRYSGISVFSGWSCSTDVQIIVDGVPYRAAAGTPRSGFPPSLCGGNSNVNFALLRNFNNFGAGQHTAQLLIDGANAGSPVTFTVTVPIPSTPFATGLSSSVVASNFPSSGKSTTLTWQESSQNFAISAVNSGSASPSLTGTYQLTRVTANYLSGTVKDSDGPNFTVQGTLVITGSSLKQTISGVYYGTPLSVNQTVSYSDYGQYLRISNLSGQVQNISLLKRGNELLILIPASTYSEVDYWVKVSDNYSDGGEPKLLREERPSDVATVHDQATPLSNGSDSMIGIAGSL